MFLEDRLGSFCREVLTSKSERVGMPTACCRIAVPVQRSIVTMEAVVQYIVAPIVTQE